MRETDVPHPPCPATNADRQLVAAIQGGRREAFQTVFECYRSDVYRFARHMTADPVVADDVTQEVFLALMRRPERFDADRGSLRAYLLGVARHVIADRLRERRWWGEVDDHQGEGVASEGDPHEALCRAQDVARVQAAVAALAPVYRDVLVSCDLLGFTYEETAVSLGCPVGTVRSRLHRARRMVGQTLAAGPLTPGRSDERCLA